MIMVLLFCSLAGAVLGQRFKVFILLPALVPALGLAILVAAIHGASASRVLAATTLAGASLQIGYIAGIGIQHLAVAGRASRLRFRRLAI